MVQQRSSRHVSSHQYLSVYLNDHLAGATAGVQLARRLAHSYSGDAAGKHELTRLSGEIASDRYELLEIMRELGVPVRRYKVVFAAVTERLGRLKLNGRMFERSPLSDLMEIEVLRLGIEGKGAGWRTLRAMAEATGQLSVEQLGRLERRAREQADAVERIRVGAAARIFAPGTHT